MLAEDTGFSEHLPTGRGLLSFNDLEEAIAGVTEIDRNYPQHMRAARELAEEYLSSEKWLPIDAFRMRLLRPQLKTGAALGSGAILVLFFLFRAVLHRSQFSDL